MTNSEAAAVVSAPDTDRLSRRDASVVQLRKELRARTLPEQIADHLAVAILKGDYRDGEHIPEQKVASMFDVSHGPVRETIRALSKRGLVEFKPRRGAFAIAVTLDAVADLFNIRAALLGLASHSLALLPPDRRPAVRLREQLARVSEAASAADADPIEFGQELGRLGNVIYHACDNAHLKRLLHEEATGSIWRHLWRERALDFITHRRRRESAADWTVAVDEIIAGHGGKAAATMRKILFDSRDQALATLQDLRGEKVEPSRLIRD